MILVFVSSFDQFNKDTCVALDKEVDAVVSMIAAGAGIDQAKNTEEPKQPEAVSGSRHEDATQKIICTSDFLLLRESLDK